MTAEEATKTLSLAGVELGGTQCVRTLAHGPDRMIEQRTVPTGRLSATLPAFRAILHRWRGSHDFRALGIACFGPPDLSPASARHGQVLATNKDG